MTKFIFQALILILISPKLSAQYGNIVFYSEEPENFTLFINSDPINKIPASNIKLVNASIGNLQIKIVFENYDFNNIEKIIYVRPDTETVFIVKSKLNNYKLLKMTDKFRITFDQNGIQTKNKYDSTNQQIFYLFKPDSSLKTADTLTDTNQVPDNLKKLCENNISDYDFAQILQTVKNIDLDDEKMEHEKIIVRQNCLNSLQIRTLAGNLELEKYKLEFLKFAYTFVLDKDNYSVVYDVLEYTRSISELEVFIKSQ